MPSTLRLSGLSRVVREQMSARRRRAGALRYGQLDDWVCPTAFYLVEKGNRPNLWVIARPGLRLDQEDEGVVQVPIPEADGELVVYERVQLSKDQDGVMGNDCLFTHLEQQKESPYTLPVLLANCPQDVRFTPEAYTLSPNGGGGRMDPRDHPPHTDDPARASESETASLDDRTGADGGTRQLLEQMLKEQERLSNLVTQQQAQLVAMQPSTGGPGVLDGTVQQRPAGNDWDVAARVAAHQPRLTMPRGEPRVVGSASTALNQGANPIGPLPGDAEPTVQHGELPGFAGGASFQDPVHINRRDWTGRPVRAEFAPIKLKGVEGLMSLEQLNEEFDYLPEKQVQEFEAIVRRDAPSWDGSTDRPMTKEQLSRCWRRSAMIGTHQQVIRISEALIDVYMDVRQGKQARALGRVALLLAAIEQASLDNGDWNVRAATILGLPEPTFSDYSQPDARQKPKQGKALGARGKLAGFARSAVADQVYKESSGLLDK